jgi:starch synthase
MCRALGWAPDVVHCNDWHTGIVPNWLQTLYKDDPFFADTATVYTIHNLAYQGVFDFHLLWLAGIGEYGFLYPAITDFAGRVNLMGRGILFGDAIATVSERYAGEIVTAENGERLDPLLRDRQDRLFGVLNGIDQTEHDPRTDPYLAANFGVETLDRRAENKAALQREAGLPVEAGVPLIGMVGRLSGQKGLDILAPVLEALLRRRVQVVLLGTGDEHYHQFLRSAEQAHPDQVRAFLTFDTPLAQRIYGGSDLFLMPSRYEPCGLGQMIAMRYGSVPVVRATGGLADTVQDWNPTTGEGNGFRFDRYDGLDLFAALVRALETYHYPAEWRRLQVRGMQGDFSWQRSARKYLDVYALALRSKERAAVV